MRSLDTHRRLLLPCVKRGAMKIELLDPARHERRGFESGNAQLDEYLHRYAMQGQRQQLVRVYVAVDNLNRVVGYCTLSAASVRHTELSPDHARRLPRYPLPAVLIGRLASDRTARATGQRIGSRLLIHALKQALRAATISGCDVSSWTANRMQWDFINASGLCRCKRTDINCIYQSLQSECWRQIKINSTVTEVNNEC